MRPYKLSEAWEPKKEETFDEKKSNAGINSRESGVKVEAYNVVTKQTITKPNYRAMSATLGAEVSHLRALAQGKWVSFKDVWIVYHPDVEGARKEALDRYDESIRNYRRPKPEGYTPDGYVDKGPSRRIKYARRTVRTVCAFDLALGQLYSAPTWVQLTKLMGLTGSGNTVRNASRRFGIPYLDRWIVFENGKLQESLGFLFDMIRLNHVRSMVIYK